MARPPRLSLPSYSHHVIQRGNNRQPIFFEEKDYAVFLREIKMDRLLIFSWCLRQRIVDSNVSAMTSQRCTS